MNFATSVWKEFLKLAREELERAIEAKPKGWREDVGVAPWPSPIRSLSPRELEEYIDSYVEVFAPETDYTDKELRVELLVKVTLYELKVDTSLPTVCIPNCTAMQQPQ